MPELSDPINELAARAREARLLAMWAIIALERIAVRERSTSPVDMILEAMTSVDPTATDKTDRDLQVKERSEELVIETLSFLRQVRLSRGAL